MTDIDTTSRKNIQKLQRAIVDALEDVKGQDIRVFDTGHLSALFERVIIASGSSNRQTKALSASVRDMVREAGLPKPRIEGEENGEWIIVDCGAAVVHVMQPAIRQYYNLEEIWGDKPVRLKFGAPKPLVKAEVPVAKKVVAKKARTGAGAQQAVAVAPGNAIAKASARRSSAPGGRATSRAPAGALKYEQKSAKPSVEQSQAAIKSVLTKVVVPAAAKKAPAKKAPAGSGRALARRASAKKLAPRKA